MGMLISYHVPYIIMIIESMLAVGALGGFSFEIIGTFIIFDGKPIFLDCFIIEKP